MNMPKTLFNKHEHVHVRRKLRIEMNKGESLLWKELRSRNITWKFRRQHSIGRYIVDFYCPELKLVIEIDGLSHEGDLAYKRDLERQKFLESKRVTVLRFLSEEIFKDLRQVVSAVYTACENLSVAGKTTPSPNLSLSRERNFALYAPYP